MIKEFIIVEKIYYFTIINNDKFIKFNNFNINYKLENVIIIKHYLFKYIYKLNITFRFLLFIIDKLINILFEDKRELQ